MFFWFYMKLCFNKFEGADNSLLVFQNPSLKIYIQIRHFFGRDFKVFHIETMHLDKVEAANFKYRNNLSKLYPKRRQIKCFWC